MTGTERVGLRSGDGEAKVNVGNNVPDICDRRKPEIRIMEFQGVTRENVSGTYFVAHDRVL